jgi:SAM-dependent methyltransferase
MSAPGPACRACGAALERVFCDLGATPLANAYLTAAQLDAPEPSYPLRAWVCERCLLVQIEQVASPEALFSEYAYFSSVSDTWLAHARGYAEAATRRFGLGPRHRVLEIASNDGYLLQYFRARGIPVLGIEPAANVARAAQARGIPTRVEFFGRALAERLAAAGERADLVVANNVLAHVPGLNDFVEGIRAVLAPRGVATLEFPHLLRLVRDTQFDTVYHEHLCYFSLHAVLALMARHALRVFDVEELATHGGSLRLYACHEAGAPHETGAQVAKVLADERAAGLDTIAGYGGFDARVAQAKRALVAFLRGARAEGRRVAAYGAAAKGNTLLNTCGVGRDLVEYVVDRSPHKQGLYLPGSRLPIVPPERIRETRPDYLLVLPWNLKEEIMAQCADIRSWGGRFVVPIPRLEVL